MPRHRTRVHFDPHENKSLSAVAQKQVNSNPYTEIQVYSHPTHGYQGNFDYPHSTQINFIPTPKSIQLRSPKVISSQLKPPTESIWLLTLEPSGFRPPYIPSQLRPPNQKQTNRSPNYKEVIFGPRTKTKSISIHTLKPRDFSPHTKNKVNFDRHTKHVHLDPRTKPSLFPFPTQKPS